ncbi:MAG TPA: di-heme oxidoredictase family protein [Isosphaeraceae bacterium]
MSARQSARRPGRAGRVSWWLGAVVACGATVMDAAADGPASEAVTRGRELFGREWLPGDSRSHGGDGLGPVFNDSSCVACHNAGAPGGAGPASKNVDILTAFSTAQQPPQLAVSQPPGFLAKALEALTGIEPPKSPPPVVRSRPEPPDTTELVKVHAGFRTARSVVLHRYGTEADYESWRLAMIGLGHFGARSFPGGLTRDQRAQTELDQVKMVSQFRATGGRSQGRFGSFILTSSQRNPTALFGAGRIDAVPDAILEAAARARHPGFPEVVGRVSRQKDGRIGRFGWKAQTPSLDDFVRTACAVELGLEVPGHAQGGLPRAPEAKAKGLDLTDDQCAALVAYVGSLPRPIEARPTGSAERRQVAAGTELFGRIGCATCHTPTLGDVDGIYSDLLLHDLGPELGDTGAYGVFVPDSSEPDFVDPAEPPADTPPPVVDVIAIGAQTIPVSGFEGTTTTVETTAPAATPPASAPRPTGPAMRLEWRTPPLWGLRDSGPYLHDGRADTIEQAIALHGGQATAVARNYFALSAPDRMQLQAFLKTLVAPTAAPE